MKRRLVLLLRRSPALCFGLILIALGLAFLGTGAGIASTREHYSFDAFLLESAGNGLVIAGVGLLAFARPLRAGGTFLFITFAAVAASLVLGILAAVQDFSVDLGHTSFGRLAFTVALSALGFGFVTTLPSPRFGQRVGFVLIGCTLVLTGVGTGLSWHESFFSDVASGGTGLVFLGEISGLAAAALFIAARGHAVSAQEA
jgi:hypothetical protein